MSENPECMQDKLKKSLETKYGLLNKLLAAKTEAKAYSFLQASRKSM